MLLWLLLSVLNRNINREVMSKKFVLISPKNRTAYNFRGNLIKDIIAQGYEVVVTGPNCIDIDKIEALGAKFVEIPMNKNGVNPIADLKYILALKKLLKHEKADATLGYTIKPVIYGAIAAKIAGVKNITSMVTGVGYLFISTSLKARLLKNISVVLYKIGMVCAHRVIFQNGDDRKEFIEHGLVKENKAHLVNGSGVDMNHFLPLPMPKRVTFFMLSRVLYSKGVVEYLEACKTVKEKYPNVRCMLLGAVENMQDSLSMDELQPYINGGIIDYYGETSDVRRYVEQCSVYVLPSYREGTPRTVLEAMAMKRPIITTDAPGCRETVVDGRNGFLVPVKNSRVLADKMEYFILHPENIEVMGEESLRYCRAKFEIKKVNNSMLNVMKLI